jgi:hypothetical protein
MFIMVDLNCFFLSERDTNILQLWKSCPLLVYFCWIIAKLFFEKKQLKITTKKTKTTGFLENRV